MSDKLSKVLAMFYKGIQSEVQIDECPCCICNDVGNKADNVISGIICEVCIHLYTSIT